MKTLAMLSLILMPFLHCQAEVQNNQMWVSEDWDYLYFKVTLVPEEDSPFHWGVWGLERGTHIFEAPFFIRPYTFSHSESCPCLQYR